MLNKTKKRFSNLLHALNINKIINKYRRKIKFRNDYKRFKELSKKIPRLDNMQVSNTDLKPMLDDDTLNSNYDHHYVYHLSWAARVLQEQGITEHVDIGSHHYFATLVSAFIPFRYYDYRPMDIQLSNLHSGRADLKQIDLEDNSISSLSCMHVIEHIGLGRYGDEIDPAGDICAIHELTRVIKHKGHLLFVVPIGRPRICYNAHRIYDPINILSCFDEFHLKEFAVVPDNGHLVRYSNPGDYKKQEYACGMYHLIKR